MDWTAAQEAIRLAVKASSGIEKDTDVVWEGTPQASGYHNSPWILLRWRSEQAHGIDERRAEFADGVRTVTICGNRRIVVSVTVEALTPIAMAVGSRIRTRFRRPSVLAILRSARLALVGVAGWADDSFQDGERLVSAAVTDLILWAGESEVDTSDTGDYIESVRVRTDNTGTEPPSPDVDVTIPGD